ncbi:MAG: TraB/GumN family protein [Oscillospiraceae bacterium]|nr:TraB/GumN family protein [Oscillospiraceae bacterium]
MKKLMAIILSLAIILGITACGESTDQPEDIVESVANDEYTGGSTADETGETAPLDEPEPELEEIPVPSDITPLFWLVTAPGGQEMYIFGSFHAAEESIYPLPDKIMNAFNNSDYLAVEVDLVAFEEDIAALTAYSFAMVYGKGESIYDDIDAEPVERAKETIVELGLADAIGVPVEMLDMFRPFFWTQLFTQAAIEQSSLDVEYGLDVFFISEAREQGMEILEIESAESQIALFLGFSPALMTFLIEEGLDVQAAAAEIDNLYEIWKRGDEQEFEDIFNTNDGMPEELYKEYTDGLLTQRDIEMARVAMEYMDEGLNVFYVVGLAHLIGENSVTGILRANGYTVEIVPVN